MNQPYLEYGKKSQSYLLTIRINQLIIMSSPKIISNLQVLLKYLFMDTYKAAPIHLGYN